MTAADDFTVRAARRADIPALQALWAGVFGDDTADISHFFSVWFQPELTMVIDNGGIPAAAAYILPVGDLSLPAGVRYPCAMLYAIAAAPEKRGLGLGIQVTRAAAAQAQMLGFPAVVLKPATESLFDFYARHTGFAEYFDADHQTFPSEQLPGFGSDRTVSAISASEYGALRHTFLADRTFIDLNARALDYFYTLCAHSGGGFYAITQQAVPVAIAAAERHGASIALKELLLVPDCRPEDAVAALSRLLPADTYNILMPPMSDRSSAHHTRFAMLSLLDGTSLPGTSSGGWYGPAYD